MKMIASAGANRFDPGFHLQADRLTVKADWKKDKIKRQKAAKGGKSRKGVME
jgi:hypothetical protein